MSGAGRSPGLLPGLAIGGAFLIAGVAGFAVGSITGPPEPASATVVAPVPNSSATQAASSAPIPAPSDDAYVAALDDSLSMGSETLAEGQSGRSDANVGDSELKVLNWVETDDPVFFITIDDGLVDSPEVREVIERNQIPVTAFLTEYAVRDKTDYFEAITAYGGSVQNHTMVARWMIARPTSSGRFARRRIDSRSSSAIGRGCSVRPTVPGRMIPRC